MSSTPQASPSLVQLGRWIRGALGYSLRDVSCVGLCDQESVDCSEDKACFEPSCAYARGFLGLGTSQEAPAPFRIKPLQRASRDEPSFVFTLSLFGALSEDHLLWLWGLQRAARRGLGSEGLKYLLTSATDEVDGELLWSLDYSTFPCLPQVAHLHLLVPASDLSRFKKLTLSFQTPLETKKALGEGSGTFPHAPSLKSLITLIVRRLDALAEAYLYPLEPEEDDRRLTQRELEWLVDGSSIYRADWRHVDEKTGRGVPRWRGHLTYNLPDDVDRKKFIYELINAGSLIGVGRGGVEGLGAYTCSWI